MLTIEFLCKISCIIYKLRVGVYSIGKTFEMEYCSKQNGIDSSDYF